MDLGGLLADNTDTDSERAATTKEPSTMTYTAKVQDQSHTATTDHGAVLGAYAKAVMANGWNAHYYPVLVLDEQEDVCYTNKTFYEYQDQVS